MTHISYKDRILGGLWGATIGDALGVPVEFWSRSQVRSDPVTGMRGYGTFNLPAGSWSDDSSLMLCTAESLLDGFDTERMGQLFIRWLNDAYRTPWGETFDVGGATHAGITRMMHGISPEEAGGTSETDNGNGSLMRILPVGLYAADLSVPEMLGHAVRASSLTHRHLRAGMACGFYCLLVSHLLAGMPREKAYLDTIGDVSGYWEKAPYQAELVHFGRILSGTINNLPEKDIRSGGYVIHTLEAGLWCLLNAGSYEEAVLRAVNLGDDTDTTGIVTGGLAGVNYGIHSIPEEWIDAIAGKDEIHLLFDKFCHAVG